LLFTDKWAQNDTTKNGKKSPNHCIQLLWEWYATVSTPRLGYNNTAIIATDAFRDREKSNSCLNSGDCLVGSNDENLYKADFVFVGGDIHEAESVLRTFRPDVACDKRSNRHASSHSHPGRLQQNKAMEHRHMLRALSRTTRQISAHAVV